MSTGDLLYAVASSLAATTKESLGLPLVTKDGKTSRQTLGAYYREYSALSTHELDIQYSTIYSQLKSLILGNKSIVDSLGEKLEEFLDKASKEFIKNITTEANRRKLRIENGIILVDTSNNNFSLVRDLVNKGFNTTNAYDISKFIKEVSGDSSIKVPTTAKEKFGFDIGHKESNIVSAYGAVIFNSIRRSKVDIDSKEVSKALADLLRAMEDPGTAASLMAQCGMADIALFKACVDATIGFTKKVVDKDLEVILKVEPKLDRTTIRKIASQVVDKVFPENAKLQQQFGASFEKSLASHISTNSKQYFLKMLIDMTRPNATIHITDIKGSPSTKDLALNLIEDTILGRKSKDKGGTTNVVLKGTAKVAVNLTKKTKAASTTPKSIVPALRNTKGQFTSLVNIETLIRARLRETIQKNMRAPALVNRTGRFANSVKLESVDNRQGTLTAFLSYMKYPYATFEPGNRQGSKARSPTALIDRSVREIAKSIVTTRMKTVIV